MICNHIKGSRRKAQIWQVWRHFEWWCAFDGAICAPNVTELLVARAAECLHLILISRHKIEILHKNNETVEVLALLNLRKAWKSSLKHGDVH